MEEIKFLNVSFLTAMSMWLQRRVHVPATVALCFTDIRLFFLAEAAINKCSRKCCFVKFWFFSLWTSVEESFPSKFTDLQLRIWLEKDRTRYTFLELFKILSKKTSRWLVLLLFDININNQKSVMDFMGDRNFCRNGNVLFKL